jgi:hypothetical protein
MSSEEIVGTSASGQASAEPASRGAHLLAGTKPLAEQLRSALEVRALIDQALGVLMGLTEQTEAEALDRLHALSRTRQQALAVVAAGIVEGATHSIRAGHLIGEAPRSTTSTPTDESG